MDKEQVKLARTIARIAHGSPGQTRADGQTPYIRHPARVVQLLEEWALDLHHINNLSYAAGWLHDVVEDTELSLNDLLQSGVHLDVVNVVDLLTKKPKNKPASPEYYERIKHDLQALTVKCADRVSNLEDARLELIASRGTIKYGERKQWSKKYWLKTHDNVLPMYKDMPILSQVLTVKMALLSELLH